MIYRGTGNLLYNTREFEFGRTSGFDPEGIGSSPIRVTSSFISFVCPFKPCGEALNRHKYGSKTIGAFWL